MCFTVSRWIYRIAYLQVTLDMRTHIYIVIMHDNMCRILIIGEFSSSLGGIKFESLKVYLIWNTSMLLLLNHFEFENQLRSDMTIRLNKEYLIESKAYSL